MVLSVLVMVLLSSVVVTVMIIGGTDGDEDGKCPFRAYLMSFFREGTCMSRVSSSIVEKLYRMDIRCDGLG